MVVIKPQSYEIEAVLALLGRYGGRETRSHVVNALWQYLLYTEIARAAAASIRNMPAGEAGASEPERALLAFCDDPQHSLGEEFAIRLERMALRLAEQELPAGVEASRDMVLETLHADELRKLRALLGDALQRWNRVAVLIDNLDKGWDRAADVAQLAHLLLGLLSALGEVASEFGKKDHWRKAVDLTLAAFLRSDIFYAVTRVSREPDKIPQSRLIWRDPQVLLRVVEERYLAGRDPLTDPSELWQRYFPATVGTRPIRDYLTWRTLPRPRDLLHLCNAAIAAAVDARNDRVTEEDVLRAEKQYSQFALEALRVENGITVLQLEDVLTGFLGLPPMMTEASVLEIIRAAGISAESSPDVLERLKDLSFLGVETNEGEFLFPEDPDGVKKADVLSSRLAERTQSPRRVQVHPAFRPYLEMPEE